jgi:serine protease Do
MRRHGAAIFITTAAVVGAGAMWAHLPREAAAQAPAAVTPKMQAPPEARSLSHAFSSVARALRPSVVRIDVEMGDQQPRVAGRERRQPDGRGGGQPDLRDFFERFFDFGEGGAPFPQPGPGHGTGSGVLLDTNGDILTNNHVVAKASKVTVTFFDGRELPAKVVGTDPQTDVAVVRLEKPPGGLVAARMGDSGKVEVGEWVLAVGSPLGMDQTVTAGIVSSKGKLGKNPTMNMSGEKVREYIQTDAKINPGNSGGPLVNLEGEVIGVNTLINTGPGGAYGFAIPINQARRVADALIKDGRMRYAFLGVKVGDLQTFPVEQKPKLPANAPERAAWVETVTPGSPASKAGVRAFDVITRIDNQRIEGRYDVVEYVSSRPIGSRVTLAYLREGKPGTLQVTLGELPSEAALAAGAPDAQKGELGIALQDLTPDMARFLDLPDGTTGAVIAEVLPGSRAAKAGLQADDVIVEVNRKPVRSAEEAIAALKANPGGGQFLRVRHGGTTRIVVVPAR